MAAEEGKVVTLKEFRTFRSRVYRELAELTGRLDNLNLNGSAAALKELAAATPQLLELSRKLDGNHLEHVVALAERRAENELFWRGLKRRLSPLSPIRALAWAFVLGFVGASAYSFAHWLFGLDLPLVHH